MLVRARLFASFREVVGSRLAEVELGAEPTVRELLEALRARHPGLGAALDSAMVAVNLEYVGPDFALHQGDEVAIIPPVSGGAGA
jgi:molybdopterin converting factor subunit 1